MFSANQKRVETESQIKKIKEDLANVEQEKNDENEIRSEKIESLKEDIKQVRHIFSFLAFGALNVPDSYIQSALQCVQVLIKIFRLRCNVNKIAQISVLQLSNKKSDILLIHKKFKIK